MSLTIVLISRISTMVNGALQNFVKRCKDNLKVIFDQWPKLHLSLNTLSNKKSWNVSTKQPINQFKAVQQSWQQGLGAYCPNIYTVPQVVSGVVNQKPQRLWKKTPSQVQLASLPRRNVQKNTYLETWVLALLWTQF